MSEHVNDLISEEQIVVKYDGEALAQNKIDLDVLTESLSGLNSLLKEVNLVVNGSSEDLKVEVEPFREGSFEYLIDVIQNPQEHLSILGIIGIGGTAVAAAGQSLIEIIRSINGRQIARLVLTAEGDCKIILENGDHLVVPSYFRPLIASPSIRKALSKIIHNPLQKEGYEYVKISTANGQELLRVDKADREPFRYRRVPVESSSIERVLEEVPVTFLTIHKDKSTHWRIACDDDALTVSVEDPEFLQWVRNHTPTGIFSDTFYVDLLVRENSNSLDKAYVIAKVHGSL